MLPTKREPTHPGVMLLEEFLKPGEITQAALAERMGVPVQLVNTLIKGKRGVSAKSALLLSRALKTTPQYWMNLQATFDLWHAQRALAATG